MGVLSASFFLPNAILSYGMDLFILRLENFSQRDTIKEAVRRRGQKMILEGQTLHIFSVESNPNRKYALLAPIEGGMVQSKHLGKDSWPA